MLMDMGESPSITVTTEQDQDLLSSVLQSKDLNGGEMDEFQYL